MILATIDTLLLFFFYNFPKFSLAGASQNLEVTQQKIISEFLLNIIKYLIFFEEGE